MKQLPPPTPPYTGGELITKLFSHLCEEGLGEGVGQLPIVYRNLKLL